MEAHSKPSFFSLQNKTFLILLGVIAILILGGGYFVLSNQGKQAEIEQEGKVEESEEIEMLPEDALNVSLVKGQAQKYILTIENIPPDIKTLSYEVQYETDSGGLQGFGGENKELNGETKYVNNEVYFGSCSKNRCTPDKGVHNIKINIQLHATDGKVKGWTGNLEI